MWSPIRLSNAIIDEASRQGGINLMLPWPDGLPRGPRLDLDEVRDATPEEIIAGRSIIALSTARIIPTYVEVERAMRPDALGMDRRGEVDDHLVVHVVGIKGLASQPSDRVKWWTGGRIPLAAAPVAQPAAPARDLPPDLSALEFADALRAYRAWLGRHGRKPLAVAELAARWGVSRQGINQWELPLSDPNHRRPASEQLIRAAMATGFGDQVE
jgi:hypothetical protein